MTDKLKREALTLMSEHGLILEDALEIVSQTRTIDDIKADIIWNNQVAMFASESLNHDLCDEAMHRIRQLHVELKRAAQARQ